jgi:hypothetical protein
LHGIVKLQEIRYRKSSETVGNKVKHEAKNQRGELNGESDVKREFVESKTLGAANPIDIIKELEF